MAEARQREAWEHTRTLVAAFTGELLDNPFDENPPELTRDALTAWVTFWKTRVNSGQ